MVFLYICDTMGSLKKVEWTERKIQDKLRAYFFSPNSKKYEITNLYVYGWESDYLAITKSMIAHEVEIKISRSDFKNDTKNKILPWVRRKLHIAVGCGKPRRLLIPLLLTFRKKSRFGFAARL